MTCVSVEMQKVDGGIGVNKGGAAFEVRCSTANVVKFFLIQHAECNPQNSMECGWWFRLPMAYARTRLRNLAGLAWVIERQREYATK